MSNLESKKCGGRIVRNAGILAAVQIVGKGMWMVLTVVTARKLGVEDFGLLAFALSLTGIVGIVSGFGFANLISKQIARAPRATSHYLVNILLLDLLFSIAAFFVLWAALHGAGVGGRRLIVVLIAAWATFFDVYVQQTNAVFRGHQEMQYEAVVRLSLAAANMVLGTTVLLLGYGLVALISTRLMSYVLGFVLALRLVQRRVGEIRFEPEPRSWTELLKSAYPFALTSALVIVYIRTDVVMLAMIKGDFATGLYNAAYRFRALFDFLPAAVVGAILPAMSRQALGDRDRMASTYRYAVKMLLLVGIPLAVGSTLFASPVIRLFFGENYMPGSGALRILLWALAISFVNHCGFSLFASLDRERLFARIVGTGAVVNVLLNTLLIPYFSHVGAALATLGAEAVVFSFQFRLVRRHVGSLGVKTSVIAPLLAASTAVFVTFLLQRWLPFGIVLALMVTVYLFLVWALGTVREEMLFVLRLWPAYGRAVRKSVV